MLPQVSLLEVSPGAHGVRAVVDVSAVAVAAVVLTELAPRLELQLQFNEG